MEEQIYPLTKIKKYIFLLLPLFVIIMVFYGLYNYAFLEISLTSPGNDETTYSIYNQGSKKSSIVKASNSSIKRLVKRGAYEVIAQKDDTSGFAVANVGGFLKKYTVSMPLQSVSGSEFIGNNPDPCMVYIDKVLHSAGCGTTFGSLETHVPASSTTPTYKQKVSSLYNNYYVEDLFKIKDQTYILMSSDDEEISSRHTLFLVNKNLKAQSVVGLTDLNESSNYSLRSFGAGFIATDKSTGETYYYKTIQSEPEALSIQNVNDEDFQFKNLSSSWDNSKIVFLSNTNKENITYDSVEENLVNEDELDGKSRIVIYGSTQKTFDFDEIFFEAYLCGDNSLCLLGDKELSIYDISGDKPLLLRKISGVLSLGVFGDEVVLGREKHILRINSGSGIGYIDHSLGDYQLCGLEMVNNDYILCLITNEKKVALLVSKGIKNNNIDKTILELEKLSEIKDVSIYKKYIFITPEAGDLVYQEDLKSYYYDSARLKISADKINQTVKMLGLDKNYFIVNTLTK